MGSVDRETDKYSTANLVRMAECGTPDVPEFDPDIVQGISPGARFLRHVYYKAFQSHIVRELTDFGGDYSRSEISSWVMDNVVPSGLNNPTTVWNTFLDLEGWAVWVPRTGDYTDKTLTELAESALAVIGARLLYKLWDSRLAELDDHDDASDYDTSDEREPW
jgi:hypothetical protein